MKRLLSVLLAAVFIFSAFSLAACRDYEIPEDLEASTGLELKKVFGGYKLVGIGTCKDSEIVIPDTVIEIDSFAFKDCTQITKIGIPSSVKKIGQQVFNGCTNLKEVYIEKGVKKLGAMLFYASGLDFIAFNGTAEEFKKIDGGKNYSAWYYVGADFGDKDFYVYCTDVILIYDFKDGKNTPETKEYEKEPETKVCYIPVKAVRTGSDGTCSSVIELGKNNLPAKETITRYGEVAIINEYIYDSDHKITKQINKFPGSDVENVFVYTYGSNSSKCYVEDDGDHELVSSQKWNNNFQITEAIIGDTSSDSWCKYEYTYNSNGRLTKEVITDSSGSSVVTYTYDSNGYLIEKKSSIGKYTYTYNSKGYLSKVVGPEIHIYEQYGTYVTYDITCDDNGNIIKIVSTDESNQKNVYTFEYELVTIPNDVMIDTTIESMFTSVNFRYMVFG